MAKLKFEINLVGLENKLHQLEFKADETFYAQYESDIFQTASTDVQVDFEKSELMIRADFRIKGTAGLLCDRTLEPFDYVIDGVHTVFFRYGDEEEELSDDLYMIPSNIQKLDLSQFVYEFTVLAVPVKKLHPRFADEDPDEENVWVFGDEDSDEADTATDPRWDALRKLTK